MRRKIVTTDKAAPLPLGIKTSDLTYPKSGQRVTHYLTLYLTQRFGWCVATLPISRAKRGGPDRTYGARLDGDGVVRMGGGPHILDTKTVYVTEARALALARLLEIYNAGMNNAGEIRDRIDAVKAALNGFLASEAAVDRLGYLWGRWQDEKEYEDFAAYSEQLKKLLAEAAPSLVFIKATKRPFGVQCTHAFAPGRVFAITATGRAVQWKLV